MPAEDANTFSRAKETEQTLVSWSTKTRPFKRRSKEFYIKLVSIASLIGIVLFIIEGIMPVLLLVSIIFLFYVLSTVEPEDVNCEITNLGIKIDGKRQEWSTLGRYWFVNRMGSELLVIETNSITGRLELMINPEIKDKLKSSLSKFLDHEEVPASSVDRASNWLDRKISS